MERLGFPRQTQDQGDSLAGSGSTGMGVSLEEEVMQLILRPKSEALMRSI